MTSLPPQYQHQPELVNAVIEARRIQMTTGDDEQAITWLADNHDISAKSAARAIEHQTFQYIPMYPEGHPRIPEIKEQLADRRRQSTVNRRIRQQLIKRDGERCRHCNHGGEWPAHNNLIFV